SPAASRSSGIRQSWTRRSSRSRKSPPRVSKDSSASPSIRIFLTVPTCTRITPGTMPRTGPCTTGSSEFAAAGPSEAAWTSCGTAWHPSTHAGYASENGPQDSDEINLLVPGGNYGWPNVRGIARTPPYLDPIIAYTPVIVPTNAAFYTATVPAASRGHLIVGSFNDHRLHELALTADGAGVIRETFLATAPDGILDVEMGLDGMLWLTTSSGVYRLVPAPASPTPVAGFGMMGLLALAPTVVWGDPWSRLLP